MSHLHQHRRRRTPFTQEEVEGVIAFKKRREQMKLLRLKRSLPYKVLNIFNVICFFIFCELVFCYNGPCKYQQHTSTSVSALHGDEFKSDGTPIVAEVDMTSTTGKTYKFIVGDYISIPISKSTFVVGKDFLLQRELKGSFEGSDKMYRVFSASPVLFLSTFTSIIMLFCISFNLNENEHSLTGLTIICAMTLLCVIFM
jgi:hypothetical protein